MSVQVKLFPTLKNLSKSKRERYEVAWREGLTPKDLLIDEGFSETDIIGCVAIINDEMGSVDRELKFGDSVELRVHMQGG